MNGTARLDGPTNSHDHRYGVFLLGDPQISLAVSTACRVLRHQFGLTSAAAFPPHITLIGSIASNIQPTEFAAAIRARTERIIEFPVVISSLVDNPGHSIVLDASTGANGVRNHSLVELASVVNEAATPFVDHTTPAIAAPFTPESFTAHFSLATHDLLSRPDLHHDVIEYGRSFFPELPLGFTARRIGIYRFSSRRWDQYWWEEMTWELVATLPLAEPGHNS